MVAKGIADLTLDQICNFIVLGIDDVTGNYLITRNVEEMARKIKELLNALMAEDFEDPLVSTLTEDYDDRLAQELAELIKQHINDLLEDKVVSVLTERIVAALENGDNLESIVGEDIATLLGDALVGALPADIAALLKQYISERIYDRMVGYVTPQVYTDAQEAADEAITILETASTGNIKIAVYVYNTSQEGE
jgi:N-acetylglucosamine kinase-like BadF-type ATPase